VHIQYLRQLLGVRQSTPSAVVLVEAGEQPLRLRWLRRAANLWNNMLEGPLDNLRHQALVASRQLAATAPRQRRRGSPGQRSLQQP
jgi:DNA-binding HxlR family transcriptional regulator